MLVKIQQSEPFAALAELVEEIAEHVYLELEVVTFSVEPASWKRFGAHEADRLVRALGYDVSGARWRELSHEQASSFIEFNIGHDLAYSSAALRPRAECQTLARRFLELCGERLRCFARHSKKTPDQDSYGNSPIRSDWTFSESYLLVALGRATLCTFLAED